MDYEYMAMCLANLSGLPVRLYVDDRFVKLFHHTVFKPDLAILEEDNILKSKDSVSYYMTDTMLYYGLFRSRQEPVCLMIGPVPAIRLNRSAVNCILRSVGEPLKRSSELINYFGALPSYPLRNFMQILCTMNYFINGEKIDVSDLLLKDGGKDGIKSGMGKKESSASFARSVFSEEAVIHNTMGLEQELLSYVEHGKTDEILRLYKMPASGRPGIMARDELRQQKNVLICTVTLVTRAAIRGGLDYETAFGLSDIYIQKGELLDNVDEVFALTSWAVLDFTHRVEDLGKEVQGWEYIRQVRNYVLNHISESVTTGDLARALALNRTYLCSAFKSRMGITINAYVRQIKMNEARRLLACTKKSLAEISEYLGFSSQSYFQNVFRSQTGVTPAQYRKNADGPCIGSRPMI